MGLFLLVVGIIVLCMSGPLGLLAYCLLVWLFGIFLNSSSNNNQDYGHDWEEF